uniref:Uncharacterized protein n=1 Tax=Anguilla anguilla TaxID=7936 RepID=A0A0E9QH93_ANGAN
MGIDSCLPQIPRVCQNLSFAESASMCTAHHAENNYVNNILDDKNLSITQGKIIAITIAITCYHYDHIQR